MENVSQRAQLSSAMHKTSFGIYVCTRLGLEKGSLCRTTVVSSQQKKKQRLYQLQQ